MSTCPAVPSGGIRELMRRGVTSYVVLIGLVALAACDRGPTTVVATEGSWGETRLVEDLRIGVYEGPDEYMFASINAIAEHPDGSIFIVDASRARVIVRRYDSEGAFLNNIGRMGEGPGEFQRVQAIKPTPDGNVALWDTQLRRITIMEPDGSFVDSFRAESGLNSRQMLLVDGEGNLYVRTGDPDPEDPNADRITSYLKYSPAGDLLEKITLPRTRGPRPDWVYTGSRSVPSDGIQPVFRREVVSMITTDGLVVSGANDGYSLEIADGDRVRYRIERAWTRLRMNPEEHAEWVAKQADIAGTPIRTEVPVDFPQNPKYPPIPETKPVIMDLWSGEDGTLWVRRYARAHKRTDLPPPDTENPRPRITWWQYPTYDVYGPEAEFLGTIEMPHGAPIILFHADYIWTAQRDEHGEAVAVRYRIEKGQGGGLD